MPLVPGPFSLQPDSAVAVEKGEYDFTADALDLADRVQTNLAGWDDFFTDMDDLANIYDFPELDAAGLLLAVSYAVDWAEMPNIDYSISMYDDANTQLGIALSFAPAAAWEDPPGPYVPPGSVLNLTAPTVPIDAFKAATTGTVGDQSLFTAPGVRLWNFTRIGSANFAEGDTFDLVFLGTPGQTVSVGGTFNGAQLAYTDMGVIDETGKLQLQGVMGPDVVGAWREDWYLDGVLLKSFDFLVTPANA